MGNKENKNLTEDNNLDDILDSKRLRWDFNNLKENGVDWWTRFLLRISPLRGVKRLSRQLGQDPDVADKAHGFFENIKRVDIVPFKSGSRGFQLILDQSTALYFYQDGDYFVYDGFDVGNYEKGDVTIFD